MIYSVHEGCKGCTQIVCYFTEGPVASLDFGIYGDGKQVQKPTHLDTKEQFCVLLDCGVCTNAL